MNDSLKKYDKDWHGEVYGVCPVQGDGKIKGHSWYFKSRGSGWRFEIINKPQYTVKDNWGNSWGEAGYMPYDDAWEIIEILLNSFKEEL